MSAPTWLRNWLKVQERKQAIAATEAARVLSAARYTRERNHVIDRANEMRAGMGLTLIPRRPE